MTSPTATASHAPNPLYVDLDGTLTPTDTLRLGGRSGRAASACWPRSGGQ